MKDFRTRSGAVVRRPQVALAVVVALLGIFVIASTPGGQAPTVSWLRTSMAGALGVENSTVAVTATAAPSNSSTTVAGTGPVAGIKVTVSQTANLVNQNVDVTWSGAAPTVGLPNYAANYMQLMQCWGDVAPDPTTCQFGGKVATDTRGGFNAASRRLDQDLYVDPDQKGLDGGPLQVRTWEPFQPVQGDLVTGAEVAENSYFDRYTTNEIPFALTRGDGKGYASFEVQTFREASGLGCGDRITDGALQGKTRNCWLVVVPRGDTEVDGTPLDTVLNQSSHRLNSSPFSATNWARRIVVPLKFAATSSVCPIEAKQRPVAGAETSAEAVLRWQPALCADNGPVFSYATIAESVVERGLASESPDMALLNGPTTSPPPSDRRYVYAPLTVSGISISFLIERRSAVDAPAAVKDLDGGRISDIKLTPRLAAKLLTQSYVQDVSATARYLGKNPDNITKDPEFLKLNPVFADLSFRDTIETLVPIGLSRSNALIWNWITSDQKAVDFVAGLPDEYGMRVNPFYQGLDVPREDFAKLDPLCEKVVAGAPALCTLDRHPYAQDFHDTGRSVGRGDALSRVSWDVFAVPPAWKKLPPQLDGLRALFGVTDTATAARYGIIPAKLQNGAGRFVGPDAKGLSEGLAAMGSSSVSGVLAPNPGSTRKGAYPLTEVTYGVTAPNILDQAAANDYATFIKYAVGSGQKEGAGVGELPPGYLPLTAKLKAQALAAAAEIKARKGPKKTATTDDSNTSGSGKTSGTGGSSSPASTPSASASPTPPATPVATASAVPTSYTPGVAAVFGRYGLLIALTLGSCALIAGLVLPRLARRPRQQGAAPASSTEEQLHTGSRQEQDSGVPVGSQNSP
ncbi:hypothetical protein ACIB24_00395 [Spongisporangium articulatum]|uniref:PBP domain-containing protein n=1 Tax=Spongisporangium articulatum TaxID=3362603 RepID=A0ABW8AGN1_9ACTN